MAAKRDPFYVRSTSRTYWLVRSGADDDNADNHHVTAREAKRLAANPTPDILSIERVMDYWQNTVQIRTEWESIYERGA
jgi:hypothetical protein